MEKLTKEREREREYAGSQHKEKLKSSLKGQEVIVYSQVFMRPCGDLAMC